jgi:hypothetical protein
MQIGLFLLYVNNYTKIALISNNILILYTLMSQSDYITYKRTAVELLDQSKNLAPVIQSGQYIKYKSFTLENTILSTKPSYTKLIPQSSVNVFGMQMNNPSGCSTFILCSGTNSRINRKPMMNIQFGC